MKWISLVAIALGSTGCVELVSTYQPISQHTLQVAADQEADVVWLQRVELVTKKVHLLRCYLAPDGPTCVEAKVP